MWVCPGLKYVQSNQKPINEACDFESCDSYKQESYQKETVYAIGLISF